ncbi:MAG TPA: PhzF family phenazine biosynthesis isomerase, partial [Mucilaginibacter sp.]|nr:PhzF family phenazine biosynthesis isomerase [Mucilaginibacter sp.]
MRTYIVDSFTKEAFKGNPAGVCFPGHSIDDEKMLKIAREFGLSETAFVHQTEDADTYGIRYFSPKKEIPLCGHATLASAKIIFKTTGATHIRFITGEKVDLFITRDNEEIIMALPVYNTIDITVPPAVLNALGLTEVVNTAYSEKNKIIVLEISDADLLAKLNPDFKALIASYQGINGVLVTAPSGSAEYDYHYRYFWPWAGTDEDPVTGGIQTFLAKYWSKKLGKTNMKAFQSSSRTGYMNIELKGDKVFLKSEAIIILEGN